MFNFTVLHCIVLHCNILYCTTLYFNSTSTVLHCTALHQLLFLNGTLKHANMQCQLQQNVVPVPQMYKCVQKQITHDFVSLHILSGNIVHESTLPQYKMSF